VDLADLRAASYDAGRAAEFDDAALDRIEAAFDASPDDVFWILHNLAGHDPARGPALMARFARLFPRAPGPAVQALYYVCTNNARLLDDRLVGLLVEHLEADPAQTFQALGYILHRRPELLRREAVRAVVRHLGLQAHLAFDLIREIAKQRPDETPLCALALFECLVREPRGWRRREMLSDIVAIADRSHVRAGLEEALRKPPETGSRPARALLAVLFRQSSRALQRVLLEALHLVAAWDPLWDFLRFLAEAGGDGQVSSAPAARFLESAYRLHHLVEPWRFEEILVARLDLREVPPEPFPDDVRFLDRDADLALLHARVAALARRFEAPLRLAPLEEFRARADVAERERAALSSAGTTRRLKRRRSLEDRLERWRRGETDPKEARALSKKVADALRAQALELTGRAVEAAAREAYRNAIRQVLGRELDPDGVDAAVLPAFLYHARLGPRFPNNRRWLARLIEDRIEGRASDWLRAEPPALEWAARVRAVHPQARLERWRGEFRREFAHAAGPAALERKTRLREDLDRARTLLARLGEKDLDRAGAAELRDRGLALRAKPGADLAALDELAADLERIRLIEQQDAASDYEGRLVLEVETDPVKMLFMGEYGFASCLSLRGANVWSAVSNAVDVDKAVVWARDASGNVVGRRLVALVPQGLLSYRTYSNRHGLALDGPFQEFLAAYADHCGVPVTHEGRPGSLLSDAWYDDGSI
jgi:hypothetical protein